MRSAGVPVISWDDSAGRLGVQAAIEQRSSSVSVFTEVRGAAPGQAFLVSFLKALKQEFVVSLGIRRSELVEAQMLAALNRVGSAAQITDAMSGNNRPFDPRSKWPEAVNSDETSVPARQRGRKVALRVCGVQPPKTANVCRVKDAWVGRTLAGGGIR